ncbi:MAG TPA: hypothetical protein VN729_08650 [Ktedonobacteraceae bacterium]|nr:hypothetical protein [Ktedonobacteraceae bacterium]
MLQQKKVRDAETLSAEVGRELMEDELTAICGGSKGSGNTTGTDLENPYGFSNLTNLLNSQAAASPKDKYNPLSTFGAFGSLSNLTSGLLGKLI